MSRRWPDAIRRRKVAEALRLYARLLVEHERVRRLRGGKGLRAAGWCQPAPQVWRPLHEVALFQAMGSQTALLSLFCSRYPDGEVPARVPCPEYLAALRIAIELAGDAIVQNGGEPPWGTGEARAPESAETFDVICCDLRDRDSDADELGSLAAILDSADLPPVPAAAHRVVFDAGEYVLAIDGVAIALPEGQERDFFRSLIAASKVGRVMPVEEHGKIWKGAVDRIRKRIQKATGRSLLREVLISAKRPVCGYRLNPNVEIRFASEAGLRFMPTEIMGALAHPARDGRRHPPREEE